ncbi:hypothetical protein AUJ14_03365 [Candidatus Micrarchaeota archaeon CG1_02_55_22]|nr:MAG: hypothetical protein AUJ14_03365 [Candidatus Micrarchaeota archaeon CG1_02_55_22]
MMSRNVVFGIAVLALIAAGLYAFGGSGGFTGRATAESEFRVGSVLLLTGDGSSWGEASRNGLLMAQDDLNRGGGVNGRLVKVLFQDDRGNPTQSVNAFNELTDAQGVRVVIGFTWSNLGLPVAPLAARKGVLTISPSLGLAEFNEASPYIFNTWPHDELLSAQLADRVYAQGHRRVAVVGARHVWVQAQTNAFTKRFTELGGTVAVAVEPLTDAVDVSSDAAKIAQAQNVSAVVYTTDGVQVGVLIAKKLKELGVQLPQYGVTIDAATIASAKGAYDGLQMLTFQTPSVNFAQRYRERFGLEPDIGADSAYDALMLVAEADKVTGSEDPKVLSDYLNSVKEYDGASGHLVSDGKGAFTKPYALFRVVNGSAVPFGG